MKKPFDWNPSLLYADKPMGAYTVSEEGSLDWLLFRMWKKAYGLNGTDLTSEKALNIAYYLAVGINRYATLSTRIADWSEECLSAATSNALTAVRNAVGNTSATSEVYLVSWMAWAILTLQEKKTKKLEDFLDKYRKEFSWYEGHSERMVWRLCRSAGQFPQMVESMDRRFNTDLRPSPLPPSSITDELWSGELTKLDLNEFLQLLRLYRTREEQVALIDIARGKHMEKITPARLLWVKSNVTGSNFPIALNDGYLSGSSLEENKTKALEAQVEALRKALEERDATDRANQLVREFDKNLERQYEEYRTESETVKTRLQEDLAQIKTQTAKVIEENHGLKKENQEMKDKIIELQDALSRRTADDPFMTNFANKKQDELLARREKELMELKKTVEKQKGDLGKMAKESIEYCINDLTDIYNSRYEERETALVTAQDTLSMLVRNGFAKHIDSSDITSMLLAITGIKESRDRAKKQQKIEQRQEASVQQGQTQIIVNGGTYNENVTSQSILPAPETAMLPKGGER